MGHSTETVEKRGIGMPPVVGVGPRVLVLGSMPGAESLRARAYYAHPRNSFWPIMGALFGFPGDAPYKTKLRALKENKVALWDVIHSCKRRGSLDSSIEHASVVLNVLAGFVSLHCSLKLIAFNGRKAEAIFRRKIASELNGIALVALPSTSPAYASLSREAKCERWGVLEQFLKGR